MAKIYTLDKKLLVGTPEVRVDDKVFPVDDRKKTVSKILEVSQNEELTDDQKIKEVFGLAFGKKAPEVNKMVEEMPWAAYQELFSIVLAAVTGQDYEPEKKEDSASSES